MNSFAMTSLLVLLAFCKTDLTLANYDVPDLPCQNPTDINFLLDSTRSLGPTKELVDLTIDFVDSVIKHFVIAPCLARVSVVQFAHTTFNLMCFNDTKSGAEVSTLAHEKYVHIRGSSKTYKALKRARYNTFSEKCGARVDDPDVAKFTVLVTDGLGNKDAETRKEADLLKADGVNLVTVGVGEKFDESSLASIASFAFGEITPVTLDALALQVARHICLRR